MFTNPLKNSLIIHRPGATTLSLKVGEIVFAKILQVNGDQAQISLGGHRISAQLETELTNNTIIPLQVREVANGKIFLGLLNSSTQEALLSEQLKAFGIKLDQINIKLAYILLSSGKELNLRNFQELKTLFPGSTLDSWSTQAAVLMLKHNIPLTPENLTVFRLFVSSKFNLADFFENGFNPLNKEDSLGASLRTIMESPLSSLLKNDGNQELPAAFLTALKAFNSVQRASFSPFLSLFIPVLVDERVHITRVNIEGHAKTPKSGALRLTFLINTANLGQIQIELTLLGKTLDIRLFAAENSRELLLAQSPQFTSRLKTLGFTTRSFVLSKESWDEEVFDQEDSRPIPLDLRV